ncbi:50S ribosomal protein L25 [Tumebacillus permanentifrigoris]|uniref:Large ribosomal subunit protein bL25 n=1 Tax=Tumebacillus permanentifrigoris TaxID=378543 RepID=A0A316D968_9BACL|nr:50S ribosomal protein L25 [Tumebacillus permanentifrigoris]PWK07901.1 large subunit ribosomal protein L25 [Tumebacillus permanentifrigoris]
MADRITLEAHRRTAMTKGERNRIRAVGDIPGIVYGREQAPTPIYIKGESFKQLRNHGKVLVDIQLDGSGTISAMINEVERDMINRRPIHIDLHAVNLREPISVDVQLILDGLEAVEKRGAVIQQLLREVTVRCLPTQVPEYILHNISTLEVGENSTCGDLKLPQNVALEHDLTEVIAMAIEAKNPEPETEIEPKEPELVHDTEGKGKETKV